MIWKDDEDEFVSSPSSPDSFTRADHGEREALRKKIEAQGKTSDASRVGQASRSELEQLKAQVAGKSDDEKKRQVRTDKESDRRKTFGTRTLKEREEEKVLNAQTTLTTEQVMDASKNQESVKDQSQEEYQSEPG